MVARNEQDTASGLTYEAVGWALAGFERHIANGGGDEYKRVLRTHRWPMTMFLADHELAENDHFMNPAAQVRQEGFYWVADDEVDFFRTAIDRHKKYKLLSFVNKLSKASDPEDEEQKARMDRLKAAKPQELSRAETLIRELGNIISRHRDPIVLDAPQTSKAS